MCAVIKASGGGGGQPGPTSANPQTWWGPPAVHDVGERILFDTQGVPEPGVVRFLGTTEFGEGEWVGIELDRGIGKNDGSVRGVSYFKCPPRHGVFCRANRVIKPSSTQAGQRPRVSVSGSNPSQLAMRRLPSDGSSVGNGDLVRGSGLGWEVRDKHKNRHGSRRRTESSGATLGSHGTPGGGPPTRASLERLFSAADLDRDTLLKVDEFGRLLSALSEQADLPKQALRTFQTMCQSSLERRGVDYPLFRQLMLGEFGFQVSNAKVIKTIARLEASTSMPTTPPTPAAQSQPSAVPLPVGPPPPAPPLITSPCSAASSRAPGGPPHLEARNGEVISPLLPPQLPRLGRTPGGVPLRPLSAVSSPGPGSTRPQSLGSSPVNAGGPNHFPNFQNGEWNASPGRGLQSLNSNNSNGSGNGNRVPSTDSRGHRGSTGSAGVGISGRRASTAVPELSCPPSSTQSTIAVTASSGSSPVPVKGPRTPTTSQSQSTLPRATSSSQEGAGAGGGAGLGAGVGVGVGGGGSSGSRGGPLAAAGSTVAGADRGCNSGRGDEMETHVSLPAALVRRRGSAPATPTTGANVPGDGGGERGGGGILTAAAAAVAASSTISTDFPRRRSTSGASRPSGSAPTSRKSSGSATPPPRQGSKAPVSPTNREGLGNTMASPQNLTLKRRPHSSGGSLQSQRRSEGLGDSRSPRLANTLGHASSRSRTPTPKRRTSAPLLASSSRLLAASPAPSRTPTPRSNRQRQSPELLNPPPPPPQPPIGTLTRGTRSPSLSQSRTPTPTPRRTSQPTRTRTPTPTEAPSFREERTPSPKHCITHAGLGRSASKSSQNSTNSNHRHNSSSNRLHHNDSNHHNTGSSCSLLDRPATGGEDVQATGQRTRTPTPTSRSRGAGTLDGIPSPCCDRSITPSHDCHSFGSLVAEMQRLCGETATTGEDPPEFRQTQPLVLRSGDHHDALLPPSSPASPELGGGRRGCGCGGEVTASTLRRTARNNNDNNDTDNEQEDDGDDDAASEAGSSETDEDMPELEVVEWSPPPPEEDEDNFGSSPECSNSASLSLDGSMPGDFSKCWGRRALLGALKD